MRWTVFSLAGLVVAAQMVIAVAAAARGATALVQRRDLVFGGLVVFAGIVARGALGTSCVLWVFLFTKQSPSRMGRAKGRWVCSRAGPGMDQAHRVLLSTAPAVEMMSDMEWGCLKDCIR